MTNDDPHAVTGDLARLRDWWAERRGDRERSIAWIHDLENEDEARNAVNRAIDSGATLIALHIDGDDSASRATIAFVANVPTTDVVEQQPGTSDHAWMEAVAEIRDLLEPYRVVPPDDSSVDSAAHAFPRPRSPCSQPPRSPSSLRSGGDHVRCPARDRDHLRWSYRPRGRRAGEHK